VYKDIILLTTSKKMGNLCIAGVEKENGNWVRIISEDDEIKHAVTAKDARYKDGSFPQIMDVIRVKCKGHNPSYYQPENYVLDNSFCWKKLGRSSIKELLRIHPAENKPYIFYNTDKCIDGVSVKGLKDGDKYSLILILSKDVCIHVRRWPERKRVTMSFTYNGNRYRYVPITDIEFENTFLQYPEVNHKLKEKCLLVVSLGDLHTDRKHYKLIAKVLNI
jgi:hypothetical protein